MIHAQKQKTGRFYASTDEGRKARNRRMKMQEQPVAEFVSSKPAVDFLWLELTNKCNLQCTHCYAESGPHAEKGTITTSQYIDLMTEAFALGCRRVQFIGGEPTLYRDLPVLIRIASQMGFEFIEVYTNLTILPEALLQCFLENRVHVATSVYASAAACHDAITLVDGSFEKTTKNLKRVVETGLPVRASIVEMEMNVGYTDSTIAFLHRLGVQNVSASRIRQIGRGAGTCEAQKSPQMSELCGNCAGGTLCVSPTGVVSPCIMSKHWAVGSIGEASLTDIATGDSLRETRQRIYDAVAAKSVGASCAPNFNNRHAGCLPAYSAAADKPACGPVIAPGVTPVGTDCEPAAVVVRPTGPACPPMLAPALHAASDRPACPPMFAPAFGAAAERPACGPAFAPVYNAGSANRPACQPMLAPAYNAAAGAPACPPMFAPAFGADAERPACPPMLAPVYNAGANRPACQPMLAPAYNAAAGAPACPPMLAPVFGADAERPACQPMLTPVSVPQ
jgi:MoaA/NifB/PqqE/SkfB family radical SAM enzyme